jgi:hypothetical protein
MPPPAMSSSMIEPAPSTSLFPDIKYVDKKLLQKEKERKDIEETANQFRTLKAIN